jgi:hypothetical protein
MYYILSLTNSTLLTADMIFLCTEKPEPKSWSPFPLHSVMYSAVCSVLLTSHLTSYTRTKCNLHLDSSLYSAISEPAQYKLLMFQVPDAITILFRLGRLSKGAVQVRGFRNKPPFTVASC